MCGAVLVILFSFIVLVSLSEDLDALSSFLLHSLEFFFDLFKIKWIQQKLFGCKIRLSIRMQHLWCSYCLFLIQKVFVLAYTKS